MKFGDRLHDLKDLGLFFITHGFRIDSGEESDNVFVLAGCRVTGIASGKYVTLWP